MTRSAGYRQGFTLIELSIVLVIIGLIIGGVLVGQELVTQAATRAQITQIQKYDSASNTFRNKYGGIPGDLELSTAAQFGFLVTGCSTGVQGWRDGNGLLDGWQSPWNIIQGTNEVEFFWEDLSASKLIDGSYPTGGLGPIGCNVSWGTYTSNAANLFPSGKIGYGTYVYVYEYNGVNWYGLSPVNSIPNTIALTSLAGQGIPVILASNIDKKIDDGIPVSGSVQAVYLNSNVTWPTPSPATNAGADSSSTCYNSSTNAYSTSISGGSGLNCALSFKMQGAAR